MFLTKPRNLQESNPNGIPNYQTYITTPPLAMYFLKSTHVATSIPHFSTKLILLTMTCYHYPPQTPLIYHKSPKPFPSHQSMNLHRSLISKVKTVCYINIYISNFLCSSPCLRVKGAYTCMLHFRCLILPILACYILGAYDTLIL